MPKTAPPFAKTGGSVPVADLDRHIQDWLLEGQFRQWSERTLDNRRRLLNKLLWFLRQREYAVCGRAELRAFLAYVTTGHDDPGGRWGNPRERRAVRPGTTESYYNILRAFLNFLAVEGTLEGSPMVGLRPPISRADQIQPFTIH